MTAKKIILKNVKKSGIWKVIKNKMMLTRTKLKNRLILFYKKKLQLRLLSFHSVIVLEYAFKNIIKKIKSSLNNIYRKI